MKISYMGAHLFGNYLSHISRETCIQTYFIQACSYFFNPLFIPRQN